MRKVQRSQIVDYQTYNDTRDDFRAHVLAIKEPRRVHVGDYLTFLFETTDTVRYQVQEMMRAEKMVRETDILHELDTYNALLGGKGELGCTLLIEIDDPAERTRRLTEWLALPQHLYLRLADGRLVRPACDRAQIGDTRLSSVQFLKFAVGQGVPDALGSDLPGLTIEAVLTEAQRSALIADLAAD